MEHTTNTHTNTSFSGFKPAIEDRKSIEHLSNNESKFYRESIENQSKSIEHPTRIQRPPEEYPTNIQRPSSDHPTMIRLMNSLTCLLSFFSRSSMLMLHECWLRMKARSAQVLAAGGAHRPMGYSPEVESPKPPRALTYHGLLT